MKQRLAVRLVLSHLLVILVVSGIASIVLLTQSRQYFVNADRRALLVQAQVAAKNCDAVCLEDGVGTFNVSNAQIPPAAVISQNRSYAESNLSVIPEVAGESLPAAVPGAGPGTGPAAEPPAEARRSSTGETAGTGAMAGTGATSGGQVGGGQAGVGQANGQSRIQASLGNDVRILQIGDLQTGAKNSGGLREPPNSIGVLALRGRSTSGTIGRNIVAAAPILRDGKVVGAVEVRSDLRNVEGVLGDLRRRILVAVAGSALLAAMIGLWRARSIAKPLRELTIAARAVADGNFAQTLPVPKGHDELALLTATFRDMRDRVQHELAVRKAFVADASHELRTPLTAIRGAVEILQDGGAERPEVRDRFLLSLGNETNRLLGLVDGLLQLETNEQGFALEDKVELATLTYDVYWQMKPIAESKSISFFHDSDAQVEDRWNLSVQGKEAKLRQVFVNLVDNAITYSPPSTFVRIWLETNKERTHRIVEITDQGPGIPEADRERVFERFVRLDHSRNRIEQNQMQQSQVQQSQMQQNQMQQSQVQQNQPERNQQNVAQRSQNNAIKPGGAGLGLAIARSIVQAHGGTLSFQAGPEGVGTTARVELPIGSLPDR